MNTIVKIFALSLLPGIFACSEQLTEDPTVFYSEETVFGTEAGVETAVNGIYSELGAGNYYGTEVHNLLGPVSGKFFSTQRAQVDATGLNTTSANVSVANIWTQAYATVNAANTVIANLENNTTLTNRDAAIGQAYFLRGLAYFDLLRLFGDVPLRLAPTDIESIHAPRTARARVIERVVEDFELAKELLPPAGQLAPGRPGPLAANVYLAKLYVTLAGEDGGDASYWARAKAELEPVIASGTYALTPTYAELFVPGNENTVESIFELQYGQTGGQRNSDVVRLYTPSNSLFNPPSVVTFGRLRPNKETFDAHVAQYPDDPRIAATFIFDEYQKQGGGKQNIYPKKDNGKQGFALIRKWLDPSYNGTTTNRNQILLRYADVLLLMAEIENELNGPEAAYPFVNQVLARARDTDGDDAADVDQPADYADLSQDEFRQRILAERRYELLAEGHSWYDTRRRGYQYFLQEVVETHNTHPTFDPTTDFVYPDTERNLLLPIPLVEIAGNREIGPADQNPGY